jgi:hypothetical protein
MEAFKVEEIDRDSAQRSEHSWKSPGDRRHSGVGEFRVPLIDFIEVSESRNCEDYRLSVYLFRAFIC